MSKSYFPCAKSSQEVQKYTKHTSQYLVASNSQNLHLGDYPYNWLSILILHLIIWESTTFSELKIL